MDDLFKEALGSIMKTTYVDEPIKKEEKKETPDIRKSTALLRIISAGKKDTK